MDYNKLFINKKLKFSRGGSSFQFNDLPDEVSIMIFSQLETKELLNFSLTNTKFFKLIKLILYEKLVVHEPGRYQRLEYANDDVSGSLPTHHTVIFIKSFKPLLATYSFEPEFIKYVHFYFCTIDTQSLDKLPENCTVEFCFL